MCNKSYPRPHASLDNSLPGGNVIISNADQPRNDKSQLNIHMLWEKSKTKLRTSTKKISDVCYIKEKSFTSLNKEQFYDGCSKKEQSFTKCSRKKQYKNCQADKSDMWPVNPAKDMWSNRPAVTIQDKMSKIVLQEDDKNCQVNMKPVKSKVCSDKTCQETKVMWPVKPKMDMWSIPRPAKLQSSYKKKDQVKFNQVSMKDDLTSQYPVCSDKNCPENQNINMWPVKPEMDM